MKKIICTLLSLLMILSLTLTGCGSPSTNSTPPSNSTGTTNGDTAGSTQAVELLNNPAANAGNTLRYISVAPPGVFNGILWSATYDQYVCDLVFDKLLKYDNKTLEILPNLAEKWDINEEDKSITFTVRKGAKIHNNLGEMTAEDVAFTLSMILNPKYDGTFYGNFNNIVGAEEYKSGAADAVTGITLYGEKPQNPLPITYDNSESDPYKVKLTFTDLSMSNLHILASSVYILPRAYYDKPTYDEFKALNLTPVGSGPMVFKQYVIDQYVELLSNKDYWDGAPKIEKVIYQCITDDARISTMQSGAADICEVRNIDEDLGQIEPLQFVSINKVAGSSFAFIRFKMTSPILEDIRVRQALAYGFDRSDFVKSYTSGRSELVYAPVPRNSAAYPEQNLEKYEFNPEKASTLLDEAGWAIGNDGYRYKDGQKLKVSYTGVANNKNDSTKTAVMVENYKALGIELTPIFYDWATYMDTVKSNPDVQLYGYAWTMSADPFRNAQLFTTGSVSNDGKYSNKEFDTLVDAASKEFDEAKSSESYKKAFEILNKDLPVVFLNDYEIPWVLNNRVKNMTFGQFTNWTYDINKVEIVQ